MSPAQCNYNGCNEQKGEAGKAGSAEQRTNERPFLAGAPDHVGLLEAEARKTKTWIMMESLLVP